MSLFGDINKVELLGNLTDDVELRYTPSGAAVCNFSIATNRSYRSQDEWKDETEFHNIVVWGNLAEGFAQRVKKGTRVLITGRLQTRSWDGQDGQKKYKTEVVADDVFLIDRYEKGKSSELPQAKVSDKPAPQSQGGNSKPTGGSGKSAPKGNQKDDSVVDPDDLPF